MVYLRMAKFLSHVMSQHIACVQTPTSPLFNQPILTLVLSVICSAWRDSEKQLAWGLVNAPTTLVVVMFEVKEVLYVCRYEDKAWAWWFVEGVMAKRAERYSVFDLVHGGDTEATLSLELFEQLRIVSHSHRYFHRICEIPTTVSRRPITRTICVLGALQCQHWSPPL